MESDHVPRCGQPLLNEVEQEKWLMNKPDYTNLKAVQLLNIDTAELRGILSTIRWGLRFATPVKATEDEEGPADQNPYVEEGDELLGWMLHYSTQSGKDQAMSYVLPPILSRLSKHFSRSENWKEDLPGLRVPNPFAGMRVNGKVDPPTYIRLCITGRLKLLEGLIVIEAGRMKEKPLLRDVKTEDEVKTITRLVLDMPLGGKRVAPKKSPRKNANVALRRRMISIIIELSDSVDKDSGRGNNWMTDDNKDQLNLVKIRAAAEKLMAKHNETWDEWFVRYECENEEGDVIDYQIKRQEQLNVAIRMDEEAGKAAHQFSVIKGIAPDATVTRRWPAHLVG